MNAKNFVSGVSTSVNSYYAFVGLPNPTEIQSDWDDSPPSPTDNFTNEWSTWDTMIALKKITPSDVKQVVNKEFGIQEQPMIITDMIIVSQIHHRTQVAHHFILQTIM